ncbi:MAG: class I SAM-dependent methyltransferase [Candidatus Thiodiazotropha sp. (ex Epidulcina cf. delphinae)]|nr:class I SAM-dependent methyltransferase [Candidatus Thiodiazotropha sp. (ex Epidulcina cf. delphinae)]
MKSAMSAQPIPLSSRIRSNIKIYQAYRNKLFGSGKATKIIEYYNHLADSFTAQTGLDVEGARMLEIGCGQLAHQTALFSTRGAKVTGIDVEVATYQMSLAMLLKMARENGLERAVKSLARAALFDSHTKRAVSDVFGQHVTYKDLDTCVMDACEMKFTDMTFDFIFSRAVFEHIADVSAAAAETNRVLADRGIAIIYIHLFPSLSGGHNLEWLNPDEICDRSAEPWDHLLSNKFPVNTYLNKLRINDYRDIFYKHLDVQKEITITEGEKHLTAARLKKLEALGYTREDLLTRTIGFYAKRAVAA